MSKNFFSKIFIADRQRQLLKRAELAGCFGFAVCTQVSYVHPVILCTPSKLMYTQQTHEIFRPPRTLVRLATPLLLRRERRRSPRWHSRHHCHRGAPKDRIDHHR